MWLVWGGFLLIALKWFEVAPVDGWSWWWVLSPLAVAFFWFEFFERLMGRDRRQVEMTEHERLAKERVRSQFKLPKKI